MYQLSHIIYFIFTVLTPGAGLGVIKHTKIIFILFGIWMVLITLLIQSRLITLPVGFITYLASIFVFHLISIVIGITESKKINPIRFTYIASILCSVFFVSSVVFMFVFKEQLLGINLFFVPSKSMEPTLIPGDIVIVDTWKYHDSFPVVDDVVVFYTKRTRFTYIKRVKAVAISSFDAEGDNRRYSVSPEKLRNQPLSNLRGKAIFILFNIKDKNIDLSRFSIKL